MLPSYNYSLVLKTLTFAYMLFRHFFSSFPNGIFFPAAQLNREAPVYSPRSLIKKIQHIDTLTACGTTSHTRTPTCCTARCGVRPPTQSFPAVVETQLNCYDNSNGGIVQGLQQRFDYRKHFIRQKEHDSTISHTVHVLTRGYRHK